MDLRDLHLHRDALAPSDRDKADRILSRPTDDYTPVGIEPKYENPVRTCGVHLCVHYTKSGPHAATDTYANAVLATLTKTRSKLMQWGFRSPLPDPGTEEYGGDWKLDVYLGDLGENIFGYAAPEGHWINGGEDAQFGYVVLDRDYQTQCETWYSGCTAKWARKLMQVTATHEFFHLVQFGYDYDEDRWFMEATATWIEDEVFDDINDNVNHLWGRPSAMRTPHAPLDTPEFAAHYGNWIFFRHLSERFGRKVVREAWRNADAWHGPHGNRSPRDLYSLRATRVAVKTMRGKWNKEFAKFADANRRPHLYYKEASYLPYPRAPRRGTFKHSKGDRRAVAKTKLSRLSSATYRFRPARNLRRGWKLGVKVVGNPQSEGGFAIASIKKRDGRLKRVKFRLGRNGKKVKYLPYGRSKVRWIEVTVVNASTRYDCYQGLLLNTCEGQPLDDRRRAKVVTRAVR